MAGYSILLSPPWQRIYLGEDVSGQVKSIIDRAMENVPKEISPDESAPLRHKLEYQVNSQLKEARGSGAIDYYFPPEQIHGVPLNASFIVSTVIPDALADDEMVGGILAELIADGSEAIEVGGTVWARSEKVIHSEPSDFVEGGVASRKVDYVSAAPDEPNRWTIVTFTALGDGNADSDITHLLVELFDAMMTSWRWSEDGDIDGN